MRRILTSLLVIGIVGVAAFGASRAFFSDTETSSGNVLAAGAIDLQLGAQYSSANNGSGSFALNSDVNNAAMFSFSDLKPGDNGRVTFRMRVQSNDAYTCAMATVDSMPENGIVDPEADAGDTTYGATGGELQKYVEFLFFGDMNNNDTYESGTDAVIVGPMSIADLNSSGWQTVSDSLNNYMTYRENSNQWGAYPMNGNQVYELVGMYCFGEWEDTGSGYECEAPGDYNDAQTDQVSGSVKIYAVQARNNDGFVCSSLPSENEVTVGANLAAYSAPVCNVTVNDVAGLQTEVGNTSGNEVICLNDGTYNLGSQPLVIDDAGVVLAGVNGPTNTAEIVGGIRVEAGNVTITGLQIGMVTGQSGVDDYGVYLTGSGDDATISFNKFVGPGDDDEGVSSGIITQFNLVSGANIMHNEISGYYRGMFLNPSSDMMVSYNTIKENYVGIANDHPDNNSLTFNIIRNNGFEGVGYDGNVSGASGNGLLSVNFNNIYGNGAGTFDSLSGTGYELNNYDSVQLNAKNNWWGDASPADEVSGDVDYDPYASSAYSEY